MCSHTYDHELLPGRSLEAIRSEMLRGIEAVERVVGYRCPYFRAPYGSVDANVVAVADELGVQLIGWEASISDSAPRGTDPDLQLSIAQRDVRPGSILLGHFGGTNSYEVLSRLLAWLGDEGYSVGSVAELIDGTTAPLAELGTSEVTVDLPGVGGPGALVPAQSTATHPWSLSTVETVIDVVGVAMILLLIRRRFRPRRRRRAVPAPATAVVMPEDTVSAWEARPPDRRASPPRRSMRPLSRPRGRSGAATGSRHHGRMDMKIGITVGLGSRSESTIDGLVERVKDTEARSFPSVWMTNAFGFDAITALSAAGRETRPSRWGPQSSRRSRVIRSSWRNRRSRRSRRPADGSRSASASRTRR